MVKLAVDPGTKELPNGRSKLSVGFVAGFKVTADCILCGVKLLGTPLESKERPHNACRIVRDAGASAGAAWKNGGGARSSMLGWWGRALVSLVWGV